ncbi:L,D-transpeptidase [Sphingomonas sp. PAMC26645]|uniref:L,D-transpeptidase n=1 Tax=Sphingomonas sp. PAMC26645 TaxID=2565555 RepID=UPI00109DB5A4|nr:L,D-transpeptidase [Sphingomonas sp. PAMC26645]QCB42601.1 L,D-transpeptidase [Sphingomonas sp. PAMC26645]
MSVRLVAILVALASTTAAIGQSLPVAVDGQIERMKPGEFLWAPQIAPEGPVTVIVSLKTQRAYAYRNGVPIGVSTISSGTRGHATPTGVFTVLQKAVDHKSNLYSDAPMPFMQRLTWGGIAMHAGNLPGYPASHGCIRLPRAFAKLLYGITRLGMTVVITDDAAVPVAVPTPPLLSGKAEAAASPFVWHPERAPTGPVSIVVSGRDRRLIVLRNGVEIGSSDIAVDDPVTVTEAFTLGSRDASGAHWLRLPLPGQAPGASAELSPEDEAKGHLPPGFGALLETVLTPGTTLLITRDTLKDAGTGEPLTVIATDGP